MHRIRALGAAQHGLVARWQVDRDRGAIRVIDNWARSGRLERVHFGVYSFPGHADTWQRALWAAHLHAGAESVVSHESAGRLWGLSEVPAGRVVLSVPRGATRSPTGVRWCRIDDLPPADRTIVRGLPCTTLDRTLVDLGRVLGPARLRLVVERALLEHRLTVAQIGATFARVRRRGKPGVRRMETVLDAVGPGANLPASELEALLDQVVRLAGVPTPRHEHPLPSHTGRPGFVDRYWPDAMLAVEADGRRWHGRHQQMAKDSARSNEAMAVGCVTARFMWEHLQHDPVGTADLLRKIYDERIGGRAP